MTFKIFLQDTLDVILCYNLYMSKLQIIVTTMH